MHFQLHNKLTATPQGILLNGEPLCKSTIEALPLQSLRHIACALEWMLKMTDEDWGPPKPHGPNDIPKLAMAEINLAMASPGTLIKYSPDQPRDDRGRWTAAGNTGENGLEHDRLASDDKGIRIASNDYKIPVPAPFGFPIIQPRKHPSAIGSDDLDDSSHSRSYSWPSLSTQNEEEDKNEAQHDQDTDEERRKYDERKKHCLAYCQYELDMPGRKDNFGPHRACMRRCMNAGCFENF